MVKQPPPGRLFGSPSVRSAVQKTGFVSSKKTFNTISKQPRSTGNTCVFAPERYIGPFVIYPIAGTLNPIQSLDNLPAPAANTGVLLFKSLYRKRAGQRFGHSAV